MPTNITMPALSPTMEAGTLARWLKAVGDAIKPGDVLAEIETDKATMEVEAVDEGVLSAIVVQGGTEEVKVGAVIGAITVEGEDAAASPPPSPSLPTVASPSPADAGEGQARAAGQREGGQASPPQVRGYGADPAADAKLAADEHRPLNGHAAAPTSRVNASPLARRLAEMRGVALAGLKGSGPNGRIVKADLDGAGAVLRQAQDARSEPTASSPPQPADAGPVEARAPQAPKLTASTPTDIPHEAVKLSNMRKVIARRLTESKQTVPHYYLAIDCRLDALLKLRAELNAAQAVKLSVNDLLIKALALALKQVPDANVSYTGDALLKFTRADISVAVAIPDGLITPVIVGADSARLSEIATAMKTLAGKAKDGKLQPHEYQGGTASLSNLGMYGIKQFEAVINPPQGMILAVGAGDRRPWVEGEHIVPATVLTATGSFDHRAIDGATGAQLMAAMRDLVEKPLGMLV